MQSLRISQVLGLAAALTLTLACSRGDSDAASTDSAAVPSDTSSAASVAPAAAGPSGPGSVTADDIDRWQKGLDAELEAVKKAAAQLKSAKNGTDTLAAMSATTDMSTRSVGAKAAGVDEERYQVIRSTLSTVVGQMAPLEQEMDVSKLPATAVAELKKSREEGLAQATAELSPQLVEALRPRAAALRKQDLTLTAERLKAAGVGG